LTPSNVTNGRVYTTLELNKQALKYSRNVQHYKLNYFCFPFSHILWVFSAEAFSFHERLLIIFLHEMKDLACQYLH